MGKLTARAVATESRPGMHGDGEGLYLRVTETGTKSWMLRTRLHGKRVDMGLGTFPAFSLAEARERAREWRKQAREGRDPRSTRIVAAPMTFEQAARRYHSIHKTTWVPRHASRWLSSLERYAFPHFGKEALADVTAGQIHDALVKPWAQKNDTARRVLQRISGVMEWATAAGHFSGLNPATGVVRTLPKVRVQVEHMASMPYADVPAFYARLTALQSSSAAAMRFLILTACRSGEARGARWAEIDGDLWTIPAARMKAGEVHRVPLSGEAQAVAQALTVSGADLVFPSPVRPAQGLSGRMLSDNAFDQLLKRMKVTGATAHGFRTSFRTWAAEVARADRELAELCLAHRIGNAVEQAYNRTDLLAQRRKLMEAWANFVTGNVGDVIQLHREQDRLRGNV